MKIEEILKKQGEIYKSLTNNKIMEECNETIKSPKLIPYGDSKIQKQEYEAITGIGKMLGREPTIVVDGEYQVYDQIYDNFIISIEKNQITFLRIVGLGLTSIPGEIYCLPNLQELHLFSNKIQEIKNLNNLQNLQTLWLGCNKIKEIKGLDNLTNIKQLYLQGNQIRKLENLDDLINLKVLYLSYNKIKEIKNLDNLQNLQKLWLEKNQITEIKNLNKLQNLEELDLERNRISKKSNKKKIKNLRNKGVWVWV